MRCPACGASELESAGARLRCPACRSELDSGDPRVRARSRPANLDGDPSEIDLSDEISADPSGSPAAGPFLASRVVPSAPGSIASPSIAQSARGVFAAPPSAASAPFAAPPPNDALAREAREKKWARALGDGGPPIGLDLLVLVLAGVDLLSMGVWWRSNVPLANAMLLPLLGSLLVAYFFWKGRNWARFLLLLGSLLELVVTVLAFVALRRHFNEVELVVIAFRLLLDGWIVWFCVRPDTVAYFERRRR